MSNSWKEKSKKWHVKDSNIYNLYYIIIFIYINFLYITESSAPINSIGTLKVTVYEAVIPIDAHG